MSTWLWRVKAWHICYISTNTPCGWIIAVIYDVWPWWRHQMETFSLLLAICAGNSPVPGEFPTQRPVTRSFDVYFDLRPNKRLSKQSSGWWFETLSPPLWRHRNGYGAGVIYLSGSVLWMVEGVKSHQLIIHLLTIVMATCLIKCLRLITWIKDFWYEDRLTKQHWVYATDLWLYLHKSTEYIYISMPSLNCVYIRCR